MKVGRPPRYAVQKCEGCDVRFRPDGQGDKQPQRFHSKLCWYRWHRGENHQQFTRETVTCEWCGDDFSRNSFEIRKVEHHYCSARCSGRARSAAMRCGVAQPASYYGLAYWREIRERIIARDGGCVHCGMTEQEHRQRFGCSLHVHHKISRAKGGSDDESNLETRCCGSHAQETNSGR